VIAETAVTLRCGYCGAEAVLRPLRDIGKSGDGMAYVCSNFPSCDAYVGCHPGTEEPMGTLARKRLRRLRVLCHAEFDPLWQKHQDQVTRSEAYEAAAVVMRMDGEFHIGRLDESACERFLLAIPLIAQELDRQVLLRRGLTAAPAALALDILSSLFDPAGRLLGTEVPAREIQRYPEAWQEAIRCGLVAQEGEMARLTPRGLHELKKWGRRP